jgi:hypothetical protein
MQKAHEWSLHRYTAINRHFLRDGFNGFLRARLPIALVTIRAAFSYPQGAGNRKMPTRLSTAKASHRSRPPDIAN